MSSKKTQYKRLNDIDHVLHRSGMYIGSLETADEHFWLYNEESSHIEWRQVKYNPGLYKIIDEIIANAYDEFKRSQYDSDRIPVKSIEVSVEGNGHKEPLVIRVTNHGDSIPIERTEEDDMWIPEMLFSDLHSSSNYDDSQERDWVGTNGMGSCLTNIYSKQFTVSLQNPTNKKTYTQTWRDNMKVREDPVIKKSTATKGFVTIEFEPDLTRFCKDTDGAPTKEFVRDLRSIIQTRTIQLAAIIGSTVKVHWCGEHIAVNSFEKFTKLFIGDRGTIAHENAGERWEVSAMLTRQLYNNDDIPSNYIAFVNGSPTVKGGKHVDYVTKQILGDICELVKKKKKIDVKPGQIKDSIIFFINCTIINPTYSSQTKEELTTTVSKFGSKPEFTGKLVDGLVKMGIVDEIVSIHEAKTAKDSKKTDGKKRHTLRGLPKLEDAHFAGTAKSQECTLILTEGDSAATSAMSGLQVVGPERWGIFPLRGKLLNVKDITSAKFNANEELAAIKRIIGLKQGTKYTSVKDLRYGRVMVMADQDHDGSHIKGLLMNLFHTEWPELLKMGFICSLLTPILKATKGKQVESFYTQAAFDEWKKTNELRGWSIKYYKGLGTSTPNEAKEWFQRLNEICYEWDEKADDSINLAFHKKRADDRKDWLVTYDPARQLEIKDKKASYSGFIHNELIHFSNADNIRSLPSVMDGLKPSQRKILFASLKRNLRQEIRVAQLAGYVSEHAAYHHGEASLTSTITSMAQTFVGSNNINLLRPNGQFGSRLQGGKDAASPRYIHTQLEHIVDTIFKKEDNPILKYINDDGLPVEPEYYLPVIPYIAVNGAVGIGTGFSTNIPSYNPQQIVALLRARLEQQLDTLEGRQLDPWWYGFKGRISRRNDKKWITHAVYEWDDSSRSVTITELPVGVWTKDYKTFLDSAATAEEEARAAYKKEEAKVKRALKKSDASTVSASIMDAVNVSIGLESFESYCNDVDVKFVLFLSEEVYDDYKDNIAEFEKAFKLTKSYCTTNMCCFDSDGSIKKYNTVGDIIEAYYTPRLIAYNHRKKVQLDELNREIVELSAKQVFVKAILEDKLKLIRATDESIVAQLRELELPPLSNPSMPESVDAYEYLLRMRIDRVKASAVEELMKQVNDRVCARDILSAKKPEDLWLSDLDEFEAAWEKYSAARTNMMQNSSETPKPKKLKMKK